MSRFVEIFKRHPWWIVGGVVAVVLLIWISSRGGGEVQTAVVSVGPSDAQIAATAAERVAQINTNAQTVQAQLALEQNANQNAASIALAGISADMNSNNNSAAIQINQQNVTGAQAIAKAQADAALAMLQDTNQSSVVMNAQNVDAMVKIAAGEQAVAAINANANATKAFYDGRNAAVATDAFYNAVMGSLKGEGNSATNSFFN